MLFKKSKYKVFCIGQNKTGTTTIETVLKGFDYQLGNQVQGELLLDAWYTRDFKSIIKFCKTAEAFQDVPFSLPYTFEHLDVAFPNAKFILTERDSAEQWYQSLTKFHSKLWADGKRIPTAADLKAVTYRELGYVYRFNQYVFNTPETDVYNEAILKAHYLNYNQTVKNYFKSRPEKLLVINVANAKDYSKLCSFLNQTPKGDNFPWVNKT
ncbi:sulfotransferase [Lacinutrix sp. MEBiC02404]